jgi:phenylacetate-CoA ligase
LFTPIFHYLAAQRRWHALQGTRLLAFQNQRALRVVAHAQKRSPFYRQWWQGCDLQDWQNLPSIDKTLMMANFSQLNTVGIEKTAAFQTALQAEHARDFSPTLQATNGKRYTVGLSSGTSGNRGLFLVGEQEQAGWSGVILARALPNWRDLLRRPPLRVAFFLRANSNLYQSTDKRGIQFRYFDLMTPLAQAEHALTAFQPQIIIAPPSLLALLAHAQQAGKLRIQPERLISVAEVLESQDQAHLQTVFQCVVHQIYQCTEGLLAVSCPQGRLHWQADLVAVQWQALGQGRFSPVITDLWRTTQPIIRYRLNDVIQLSESACSCGNDWQVLQAIEGRSDDVCYFADDLGEWRVVFPDVIRRMVLLAEAPVLEYQAVQSARGQLRLAVQVAEGADFGLVERILRESVVRELARYRCVVARLEVVEGIAPVPAGVKRRRVIAKNM